MAIKVFSRLIQSVTSHNCHKFKYSKIKIGAAGDTFLLDGNQIVNNST